MITAIINPKPKAFSAAMSRWAEYIANRFVSAAKSEGFVLKKELEEYIRSKGAGSWPKYAPLTRVLQRKRVTHPLHRWLPKMIRYKVGWDREGELSIRIGVLRGTPQEVSKSAVMIAERTARGGYFEVTRETQAYIAELLRSLGYSERTIKRYVPHIGRHYRRPRPFIEPVFTEERKRKVVENIKTLLIARILTGRKIRP